MTLLKDVSGGQGVGTAWRQFDGTLPAQAGKFYHKIDSSNLTMPDKGFFYEAGWSLVMAFFSTGRLAVVDGRGKLYYNAQEDKTSFSGVVITLEEEDGNAAPGKHILEGNF